MRVRMDVQRFDPDVDRKPYWKTYWVDAQPVDRVLDLLHTIKWTQDGTLTFRRSCGHGICGSDAMLINGKNRLACKTLVKDLARRKPRIKVAPLMGMTVVRDLVVDMEPFFEKYRRVRPYLINDEAPPKGERIQSQEDRLLIDDTTKCILCAACTTSCPSFWANDEYIGPAAIVQGHRFLFDTRDRAREERLVVLNDVMSVWRCRTVFNCVNACPQEIDVTKAIGDVKRTLLFDRA